MTDQPPTVLGDAEVARDAFAVSDGTLEHLARVWTDTAGFCATVFAALGDQLGYWRALDGHALDPDQLAEATGTQPRYAREWAYGMVAAGYLDRDADGRLLLSPDLAPVLAEPAGIVSAGGVHEMLLGLVSTYPQLVRSMREGGGVGPGDYHPSAWSGLDRFSASTFEHQLLRWITDIDGLHQQLEEGCRVVDIGCGHGRAAIRLAQAYPRSTFVGLDLFAPVVEQARRLADEAGVADRVSFLVADAADPLPAADLVTSFDVLHEADDPRAMALAVRAALRPGGHWLVMEVNCAAEPEGNRGPLGTMLYGYSLMFCLTTTLARDGIGLGTCGVTGELFAELARVAGFSSVAADLPDHPFHRLHLAIA